MAEIRSIMSTHHPMILGLSEANFLKSHDSSLVQIPGFEFHKCPTIENPNLGVSRIVAYTHSNLVVKERSDLMNDTYSSIWIEIGLPRQKRFLVCQTNRDWQYLNENGDRTSLSIQEQFNRWVIFLDQWELALATGMEIHCLGDMNINHCNWRDSHLPSSNQSYKLRDLISVVFERIFNQGVVQLINGPTRHFPGQAPSGLDHY